MTIERVCTCDFCGCEIEGDDEYVSLSVDDSRKWDERWENPRWNSSRAVKAGWLAHYHCGLKRCYRSWRELFDVVHDHAQGIGAIPVAEQREIDRHRAGYVQPDRPGRDAVWASLRGIDLPPMAQHTLMRNQIDLEAVAQMSDDELLALEGVGHTTVRRLREAVASLEVQKIEEKGGN
jgi:hypothetical protein